MKSSRPLVRQHFPKSKWQKTHYAWYKSKIKTGEIQVPGMSAEKSEEIQSDDLESEVEESIEARISLRGICIHILPQGLVKSNLALPLRKMASTIQRKPEE